MHKPLKVKSAAGSVEVELPPHGLDPMATVLVLTTR
jgi:hypothetical protein